MNLNERIKQMREAKGLTQKEMSEQIGVTERAYVNYEKNRFPREEGTLRKIAKALDTTVAALLNEDSDSIPNEFIALARSAESLSPEERSKIFKIFKSMIEVVKKD